MLSSSLLLGAFILLLLLHCLVEGTVAISHEQISSHLVEFTNDCDEEVVVDWVSPTTLEPVEFFHLEPGQKIPVNTFANHTFFLRRVNDNCEAGVCRNSVVTITDDDDQGEFFLVKIKIFLVFHFIGSFLLFLTT